MLSIKLFSYAARGVIALISILQIATVIIGPGDVTLLGEAYAFGVAWRFAMKSLAVTVLRFTRPDADRWRVPLNPRLGSGRELPIGLMLITALLFILAGVNLLTKQAATIGGASFTILFFVLLTMSERFIAGKKQGSRVPERFCLEFRDDLSPTSLKVRPGGIVVGVHDPDQLHHLNGVLEKSDPSQQDVILVAVKSTDPADLERCTEPNEVVGEWEVRVFTTAVAAAEDAGKPVTLVELSGDRHTEPFCKLPARCSRARLSSALPRAGSNGKPKRSATTGNTWQTTLRIRTSRSSRMRVHQYTLSFARPTCLQDDVILWRLLRGLWSFG